MSESAASPGSAGAPLCAERIEAVAEAARAWRDPRHPARAEAVRRTLAAPNRFTEEALAFAVNAATHGLTEAALRSWWGGREAPRGEARQQVVGVAPGSDGAPLAGLRAVLAVLLAGHRCVFCAPECSPALVPAFVEAVQQRCAACSFACAPSEEALFDQADAAIGGGEEAAFAQQCEAVGLPPARRGWQSPAFSVAVLDGHESEGDREGLAEDALLYEGLGRSSVALLWAPAGTAPDPYLEAMAHFRAVFPAHPDTPGALQMQKAFLDAQGQPHAHGGGLEFLMSRGTPEVQAPGHLRWTEYDALEEVQRWLEAQAARGHAAVHAVAARPALAAALPPSSRRPPVLPPGTLHRQGLDAPGAGALLDFVGAL